MYWWICCLIAIKSSSLGTLVSSNSTKTRMFRSIGLNFAAVSACERMDVCPLMNLFSVVCAGKKATADC